MSFCCLVARCPRSSPTFGSAVPPQNYPLSGQDRLNNQYLFRPKMPQRWCRMQSAMPGRAFPHRRTYPAIEGVFCPLQRVRSQDPLLGEPAHGRCFVQLSRAANTAHSTGAMFWIKLVASIYQQIVRAWPEKKRLYVCSYVLVA
jgi:hypothetical protein